MPFDKQLVMSVKVNRQIRKLKKQLDEAVASRRANRTEDHQRTDPAAGGLLVDQVQMTVMTLMKTWEECNKTSPLATQDPFASVKSKMKERLELLKKHGVGDADKPQFLVEFEEEECLVKEREEVSKLTTVQTRRTRAKRRK